MFSEHFLCTRLSTWHLRSILFNAHGHPLKKWSGVCNGTPASERKKQSCLLLLPRGRVQGGPLHLHLGVLAQSLSGLIHSTPFLLSVELSRR